MYEWVENVNIVFISQLHVRKAMKEKKNETANVLFF